MARTPPFLRWALSHACPFRDPARESDLEQIGRQLLVLRACGDAFAENRVFEAIAFARDHAVDHRADGLTNDHADGHADGHVDGHADGHADGLVDGIVDEHAVDRHSARLAETAGPRLGFRVAEVFAAYGGRERIESHCAGCSVNVGRAALAPANPTWGGCCGLVEWSAWGEADSWNTLIDRLLAELAPRDAWRQMFLPTQPAWPGLWAAESFSAAHWELLEPLLARLAALPPLEAAFRDLAAAAAFARRTQTELRVQLYPGGEVQGRRWLVDAHCSRCASTRTADSRVCPVCGWDAQAVPARRRGAYGGRPYWPLDRMLGPGPSAALVARYRHWRLH